MKLIDDELMALEYAPGFKIQDFICHIHNYTEYNSSEMLVRSAPWTVQLYGIQTQTIYINIYIKKKLMK